MSDLEEIGIFLLFYCVMTYPKDRAIQSMTGKYPSVSTMLFQIFCVIVGCSLIIFG
jgi:hypothetical protein